MVAQAIAIYLAPIAAFMVVRSRRDHTLGEVGVGLPAAVAADIVGVLVLSRLLPLEIAALVSRGVWLALAAITWLARAARRDAPRWPRALGVKQAIVALVVALVAIATSVRISHEYHVWDRFWHISLVSTIRGQTLPFFNVYDPSQPLSYHFAGDAMAAMFQAFSLDALHSSHALSLCHDVMFALTGLTVALVVQGFGARRALVAVALSLPCFLTGPSAALRPDGVHWAGYSLVNYVTLSFRPHTSIAGLLALGFAASALELAKGGRRTRGLKITLCVITAALAIADESSCAMVCLGLGVAWLVAPAVLGATRAQGAILLVLLAVLIFASNVACAGLLAPGAARPGISIVAWRVPGFANPTLPIGAPGALGLFVGDLWAFFAFGGAALLIAVRAKDARIRGGAAAVAAMIAVAVFALGKLNIPPKAVEVHRFSTAPMLIGPLVAAALLVARPREISKRAYLPLQAMLVLGLVLSTGSTIWWVVDPGKTPFQKQSSFGTRDDFYKLDCRAELGARIGEEPRLTYLANATFFSFTGCHPTFIAGKAGTHKIKTSQPLHGHAALVDVDRMADPAEDIDVICPPAGDAICAKVDVKRCTPIGKTASGLAYRRCSLTGAERAKILGKR